MAIKKASNGKWKVNNGRPVYKTKKSAEKVDRVTTRLKEKSRKKSK